MYVLVPTNKSTKGLKTPVPLAKAGVQVPPASAGLISVNKSTVPPSLQISSVASVPELKGSSTVTVIVVLASVFKSSLYLDIAIVYAILAFLETVVFSRYLEGKNYGNN